MAVRPDHGLAGDVEALEVAKVRDAVARTRKNRAVPGRHRLQEQVVVRIAVVGLQNVVVNVGHALRHADAREAEGVKLLPDHGAGRVLNQGLVNLDADLRPRLELPFHQMFLQDFLSQVEWHDTSRRLIRH